MIFVNVNFYPDTYFKLFILMLLYRFTIPQSKQGKPRFSGSYDVEEASETVRNSVNRV